MISITFVNSSGKHDLKKMQPSNHLVQNPQKNHCFPQSHEMIRQTSAQNQ